MSTKSESDEQAARLRTAASLRRIAAAVEAGEVTAIAAVMIHKSIRGYSSCAMVFDSADLTMLLGGMELLSAAFRAEFFANTSDHPVPHLTSVPTPEDLNDE